MRKNSLTLNSSCRVSGTHRGSHSSRYVWSFTGSQTRRRDSKVIHESVNQDPRQAARVLDDDGNDVTPLSLNQAEPGDGQSKPDRLFLDEILSNTGSDYLKCTSTFTVPSSGSFLWSNTPSSVSTKTSLTKDTEDSVLKLDMPINPPAPCGAQTKKDRVKQHVTEEMLDEVIHMCLSETDTISLLDIPCSLVSQDVNDAEAIKQRNTDYAELCRNRMGNDKYVVRSMQTFNGAPKDKEIQNDKIVMVDAGTMATVWGIYDSFCNQKKTCENEKTDYPDNPVKMNQCSMSSSSSSSSTGSTFSSLLEMETCGTSLNEPDQQQIMLSEAFQHSLLVMERSIVSNLFQPRLAAYRQLHIFPDAEESSPTPTLERLWAFSCELTTGRNITSMAWNKKNVDLLAVGYDDCDSRNQRRGLICCWSLKKLTRPEQVFHCHSGVTSLDFSANNPDQLAVGMYDGTVAIYSVYNRDNKTCVANSSKCSKKHLHPVWQVNWTKQEMRLSGEERVEALVSVSADGRITKWFLYNNGLDCIDLMKLKRIKDNKKEAAGSKKKTINMGSAVTPGLCVDFHPTDSSIYLIGTFDGLIHKCSFFDSQRFLDTYQKHSCPVNHTEWSPFSPGVFLSCSSDWTIQLWKQGHFTPVLSFTSSQRAVNTVRWSPNWSTVFAAINEQQVEIWDLNSSIVDPITVHQAEPGVNMMSLLFARGTDSVLVGDSDGQVTVYKIKNLRVGEAKQVDSLEDIVHSAMSSSWTWRTNRVTSPFSS